MLTFLFEVVGTAAEPIVEAIRNRTEQLSEMIRTRANIQLDNLEAVLLGLRQELENLAGIII